MKSAALVSPKPPGDLVSTLRHHTGNRGGFSAHAGLEGRGGAPEYRLVPTEPPVFLIIAPLSPPGSTEPPRVLFIGTEQEHTCTIVHNMVTG